MQSTMMNVPLTTAAILPGLIPPTRRGGLPDVVVGVTSNRVPVVLVEARPESDLRRRQ